MSENKRQRAHRSGDFNSPDDLDEKVKRAVYKFNERLPQEWEVLLQWLRTKAIAVPVDPRDGEVVKAEYHRKAQVVSIVNKLQGFELV